MNNKSNSKVEILNDSKFELKHQFLNMSEIQWNGRLSKFFEDSLDYCYVISKDGKLVNINSSALNILGLKKEKILGKDALPLIYTDDNLETAKKYFKEWKKNGKLKNCKLRIKNIRGTPRSVLLNAASMQGSDGKIEASISVQRDITNSREEIRRQKQSQNELKRREAYWQTLIKTLPDLVWVKDKSGKYLICNPTFENFFGAKESEIIGKTDYDFVKKEQADFFRQKDKEAMAKNGPSKNEEEIIFASDGHRAIIETIKTPMYDKNDNLIGILGIARDITKRKTAENKIRKLSVGIEQSPLAIVITDRTGKIEYVNPAFTQVTGYTQDEATKNSPSLLNSGYHPRSYYKNLWDTISSGKVWRGEFKNRRKNGQIFWEDATIGPITSEDGTITNFIALKEDITVRKDLELQLQQSQKLEAIGKLAGGVAHDFNNLLTVINGYSQMLLLELEQSSKIYHDIEQIAKAGERAGMLTQQLLAFSRKQIIQPRPLSLNTIINDIYKILNRIIGEDIKILTILSNKLHLINADPGQMNQVIMNLVINARDAMPKGGILTIETKNTLVDEAYNVRHFDLKPGPYIALSISDTGTGMPEETLGKIFEPFFTTKETGKGTGLGLSTVYGIIKQHKGDIWVYSEPDNGSVFTIYLPRLIESRETLDTKKDAIVKGGSESILLVEDDPTVLALMQNILRAAGYKVFAFEDGLQAIETTSENDENYSLLITDVVMPGLSGKKLSDILKKQKPDIKTLFISGYTDEAIARSGVIYSGIKFLQKPFSRNELLKTVRDILDSNLESRGNKIDINSD